MIVIFLGPPGAGKGTQGKKIAKKIDLPHIAVGDIFRTIIKTSTSEAELINNYVKQGALIPNEIVNQVIKIFLLSSQYKNGYILDGYPRNLEQARFFESFIKKAQIKIIYFDVADELLIKRVLGRYSCKNCGKIYNVHFLQPKTDYVCDVCSSNVFDYRRDDNEEVIKKRIEVYKTETYPLIDYYKNSGNFYIVNASKDEQEIENDIQKILKIN
ncbi:adenylate kinase [Rickettsia typhi]|uniref:Adenylate kinase n=2 Tax=Rickettsia typhi TaxID=785 RepID=KAD_RICTY|nr:adenylate kinase [Rickettsia typhi]Q68W99.1 RecName: Full=Adenylate kinase; Short=AK; AltName: Full=ATP-AMP transphosphorylase; AltName: Full=ATP:AMP phosphotransferase; AltName: Full=Adenylate monophosphate kinase [Rickettsia typhi str. Wilmington]AAU04093.1 Adenylic kinase [Rickettsia typhi str. Wilmington]AFE54472.1 adenylate kinase [Rickettsia typhi str. TH1527]AFE55311.1 adenylate kinase [Rickettsia typhi str. B9991CWPP]